METIVIVLDSGKLDNPNLDIIYALPVRLEEYTDEAVADNGYDYLSDEEIGIWLETEDAKEGYAKVMAYLEEHLVYGNDLLESVKIYVSDREAAEFEDCTLMYDGEVSVVKNVEHFAKRAEKVKKVILEIAECLVKEDKEALEKVEAAVSKVNLPEVLWKVLIETLMELGFVSEEVEEEEQDDTVVACFDWEGDADAVFVCEEDVMEKLTVLVAELGFYITEY